MDPFIDVFAFGLQKTIKSSPLVKGNEMHFNEARDWSKTPKSFAASVTLRHPQ